MVPGMRKKRSDAAGVPSLATEDGARLPRQGARSPHPPSSHTRRGPWRTGLSRERDSVCRAASARGSDGRPPCHAPCESADSTESSTENIEDAWAVVKPRASLRCPKAATRTQTRHGLEGHNRHGKPSENNKGQRVVSVVQRARPATLTSLFFALSSIQPSPPPPGLSLFDPWPSLAQPCFEGPAFLVPMSLPCKYASA